MTHLTAPVEHAPVASTQGNSPTRPAPRGEPLLVIRPPDAWPSLNLHEVWQYRDLLLLLAWRDISARYRQSIVGYGWAVIKPLLSMLMYTLVFGMFLKVPSGGLPYALMNLAALVPWMFFANALQGAVTSVSNNGALLSKVYFPRLLLPLSSLMFCLVELLIQVGMLFVLMAWFGHVPNWTVVFAPLYLLGVMLVSVSGGLWLTALNVRYRDVGQIVPFFLQIFMYVCPVVYPASAVPERFRWAYNLNPMAGLISGFQSAMLGTAPPDFITLSISMTAVIVLMVGSVCYFRRCEATFADIV
jgi:lipopolysaccharide transport system permease protein